jgi:hypothetical protein
MSKKHKLEDMTATGVEETEDTAKYPKPEMLVQWYDTQTKYRGGRH